MSEQTSLPVAEAYTIPDPKTYCPFPPAISPYRDALEEYILQFAKQYRLVQQEYTYKYLASERTGWFVARVWPYAGFEELKVIAEWNVLFFLYDDQMEEGEIRTHPERICTVKDHLLALMNDPAITPQGPFAEAFAAFWQHAASYTDMSWRKHFVPNLRAFLESYLWQAQGYISSHIPDLETYIERRFSAVAAMAVIDLTNIELGFDLPEQVYEHQTFQRAMKAVGNVLAWTNDLFSLRKEMACADTMNIVTVLRHRDNSSLQEAIDQACTMIANQCHLFQDLWQHLPSFSADIDQQVHTYLEHVCAMMPGNLYWSYETSRYPQGTNVTHQQRASYLEPLLPS